MNKLTGIKPLEQHLALARGKCFLMRGLWEGAGLHTVERQAVIPDGGTGAVWLPAMGSASLSLGFLFSNVLALTVLVP